MEPMGRDLRQRIHNICRFLVVALFRGFRVQGLGFHREGVLATPRPEPTAISLSALALFWWLPLYPQTLPQKEAAMTPNCKETIDDDSYL